MAMNKNKAVNENPPRHGEGDRRRRRWWRGPTASNAQRATRAPSVTPSARHLPVPGRILAALLAAFLAFLPTPAAAWWDYGHKTIARIAMMEVSPRTRAQIQQLLRKAPMLATPNCATATVEDISVWPDCVRSMGDRFSYTSTWHYQNVNICRPFDLDGPCANGNCVSAQIERAVRLLKDRSVPDHERLQALAFLVHFVGDMHQPMHAGDRADLGGNRFRAFYGEIRSNLHSMWDGHLAERAISSPAAHAEGLRAEYGGQREAIRGGSVTDWARESWEVSRRYAYGTLLADPCAEVPAAPPVLRPDQVAELVPIVRLQVARGGIRLARLLDEAFAPAPPAPARAPWRRDARQ